MKNERNREIWHFGQKNKIHNDQLITEKMSNSFTFMDITIMLLQLG